MLHTTLAELSHDTAALFAKIQDENEPMMVVNENRILGVIVPFHDESFYEAMEDAMDIEAARKALASGEKGITLEEYKRKIGL